MQANQTTTERVSHSSGRANLRVLPPPPDDAECWKLLLNFLYISEQDTLFVWAKNVRAAVEEAA